MTVSHFASYIYQKDLAANRPASVIPSDGKFYIFEATDTGALSIWSTGAAAWKDIGSSALPHAEIMSRVSLGF